MLLFSQQKTLEGYKAYRNPVRKNSFVRVRELCL